MSVEWRKIGYEVRLTFGFVKRMGRQCVKSYIGLIVLYFHFLKKLNVIGPKILSVHPVVSE